MKTNRPRLFVIAAVSLVAFAPHAFAEGTKKGPTSKIFLAETKGETQIVNKGKIYTARQASAFDAPGTIIETKADSHDAFVYSNGTGLFIDQKSRVEINLFAQEPFVPATAASGDVIAEPSVSQSSILVARGAVGICTSRLLTGSTMNYSTPQAAVSIRQGRVAISTTTDTTIVDLLEGDITVGAGAKSAGGQILRPGERATVRQGANGQPATVVLSEIPRDQMPILDARVTIACNARKTVAFRTTDNPSEAAGADQEIVASPTVPQNPPSNITISPDRLPGGAP